MDILGRKGNGTPEHSGSGEPGRGADGADASGRKGARANAGAALQGKEGISVLPPALCRHGPAGRCSGP